MLAERRATLWLLSATFIWGSTFFSLKMCQEAIEVTLGRPVWLAGPLVLVIRFALATILMSVLVPRAWREFDRKALVASFCVSAPGAVGMILLCVALRDGSSATIAFITSLMIVTVPVIGWIFLRERLTPSLWTGALMSLVGIFVMTDPLSGGFGWPEVVTLIAAVLFGAQIHFINYFTRRHSPEAVTLGTFIHTTWFVLLFLLVLPEGRQLLDPDTVLRIFQPIDSPYLLRRWAVAWVVPYHALVASVIGFWILMRFQRDVPATRAAIIYCLEPLFAALLAWHLAGEGMSKTQIAGGALVMAGNLACELLRRREGPAPARPEEAVPPGTPAPPPPGRS